MKKIVLIMAVATLAATSCQKNDIDDSLDNGKNQLTFGVHTGNATRAAELTNVTLHTNGVNFPLYAYTGSVASTQTPYFSETLTYSTSTSKWTTTIPRFLHNTSPMSFYAYYPTTGIAAATNYVAPTTAGTYPKIKDYIIQGNGLTTDLVAAKVNDNLGTAVTIPFRHILSQINFGVKGYYGAKITISGITIKQVYEKGTFDFSPTWNWGNQSSRKDYEYSFPAFSTPGFYSYNAGGTVTWNTTDQAWYIGENKQGTTPAGVDNERGYTYIFGDGGKWGPGKTSDIWYVTGENTVVQGSGTLPTQTLSNSLMLMPQDLTDEAVVTFSYKIQDLDGAFIAGSSTTSLSGTFSLNKVNTTDNTKYDQKWKPNLRYVYIIDFTKYLNGQALTFDVDVDTYPWLNYDWTSSDAGTGIVYISSLGEPAFNTSIKDLAVGGSFTMPAGQLFTEITWDWSRYSMTNIFAQDNVFNVVFGSDVNFNGKTITINPPVGFSIVAGTNVTAAGVVSGAATVVFKKN